MRKTVKYIGLDVHKKMISIAIINEGRSEKVRSYGQIENNMNQLDKVLRKLISQGATLNCVYETGPCGYHIPPVILPAKRFFLYSRLGLFNPG